MTRQELGIRISGEAETIGLALGVSPRAEQEDNGTGDDQTRDDR